MRGVHEWFCVEQSRERNAEILAEAEKRRLARLAPRKPVGPVLRARVARTVFGFALALEREETWRAVWERLEAPRHP
ncbi:MAG: hypothetical protein ICV31_00145 [Rubrobacter sp.]|jgi:hypothetical protein|nr:hypothetical protein [Rubrobacter sp.]